jgi:hypothetical protein
VRPEQRFESFRPGISGHSLYFVSFPNILALGLLY